MTLWRVSNHAVLDGTGGLQAAGRWHSRGRRIVYCSESAAAALLETLVHAEIDIEDVPVAFRYLEIRVSGSVKARTVSRNNLGRRWQKDVHRTRRIGDEWLRSGSTAILRVPSVIAPETWNYLINPAHPKSVAIRIVKIHSYGVDRRLLW